MREATKRAIFTRLAAALVMGGLTLVLIGFTATVGPLKLAASSRVLLQLLLPTAAAAMVLIAVLSATARAAWGRSCLANGVVAIALAAASLQTRGQPLGAADPAYERALDQGVRWWLGHLVRTATAYACAVTVVAILLFILSYWLLHCPSERHRTAH